MYNIDLAIWWLRCFLETFLQGSAFLFRMNFSPKIRHIANQSVLVNTMNTLLKQIDIEATDKKFIINNFKTQIE